MMEIRQPYTSLYYPYATFGDERWLRGSLLSWDRISLIRPAAVEASVGEAGPAERIIKRMLPDFIAALSPSDDDLLLVSNAIEGDGLQRLYGRFGPEARQALASPVTATRQIGPVDADPRLLWIFAGDLESKMTYHLADQLTSRYLAQSAEDTQHQLWLGLHPTFGRVYLTALSGVLARNHGFVAVTDDSDVHRAAGALSLDQIDRQLIGRIDRVGGIASTPRAAEEIYLHVALAASPQPVDLGKVPIENLIDFHGNHEEEIRAFRRHLDELAPRLLGLADVTDPQSLDWHLRRIYDDETRDLVDALHRALNRSRIATVLRTLTVKFDLSGAMLTAPGLAAVGIGGLFGVSAAVASAPVAVALSAIPIVHDYRRERAEQTKSPVAFLLAAERELGPKQMLSASLP
jgi:hypothetical protein